MQNTPGGIRTPDLLVRSQALYPAELRAHNPQPKKCPPRGQSPRGITRLGQSFREMPYTHQPFRGVILVQG